LLFFAGRADYTDRWLKEKMNEVLFAPPFNSRPLTEPASFRAALSSRKVPNHLVFC
jgi:hypothetical protein